MGCCASGVVHPGVIAEPREHQPGSSLLNVTQEVRDVYEIGRVIGKGQFGFVYEGRHRKSGIRVAIKKVDRMRSKKEYIETEMGILEMCNSHPYIIHLYEIFRTPAYVYLVLELMEGGELFDRLIANGAYSERDAREQLRQICMAVQFLHSKGIVHRDLKPENLLLTSSKPADSVVKIADFGLSKMLPRGADPLTTVCGTWAYSAPEMRKPSRPGYSHAVDMWSLGVIMYIILSGYHPFDPEGVAEQKEVLAAIQKGKFEYDDPVWDGVTDSARDLIEKLICVDPAKRITARDALLHPWMRAQYGSDEPISLTINQDLAHYRDRMRTKLMGTSVAAYGAVLVGSDRSMRRWSAPVQIRDMPPADESKEGGGKRSEKKEWDGGFVVARDRAEAGISMRLSTASGGERKSSFTHEWALGRRSGSDYGSQRSLRSMVSAAAVETMQRNPSSGVHVVSFPPVSPPQATGTPRTGSKRSTGPASSSPSSSFVPVSPIRQSSTSSLKHSHKADPGPLPTGPGAVSISSDAVG